MPQPSIAYAVGRVSAPAWKPLGESQLDRLLSSSGYEEGLRLLSEMGWQRADNQDVEAISVVRLEKVCKLLRSISPEPEITDAFLMRHDAQNLKALLKARILGIAPEGLTNCGTIPLEKLRHAVIERVYYSLPEPFGKVMMELEKRISLTVNPMEIDIRIDQALYAFLGEKLKKSTSRAAGKFFSGKVDILNLIAFLRLEGMGMKPEAILDYLLPGGTITKLNWARVGESKALLDYHFLPYGRKVLDAMKEAAGNLAALPMLEKAMDDYLLSLFKAGKVEPFSLDVLLGWLLAHEREAAAVRLIMAGKLNGFSREQISERLREAYGR